MIKLKRTGVVLGSLGLLLGAACNPSLDVTNPNAPDTQRANASPADVEALAISSVHSWYIGATDYEPWLMLSVTADALTCNFGNFGMRFNNLEPRIPYANLSSGGDRGTTESPWKASYRGLVAANNAIRGFNAGLTFPGGPAEGDKFKRLAQFTQAASLTQLALVFDRAFIADENTDINAPAVLSDYKAVSDAAVTKWAALAAAEVGKTDTYDPTVFPLDNLTLSSDKIGRIANTMAALTLAYTPRTKAEAATVDWAKVATFAAKGIGTGSAGAPFDLSVIGDLTNWYSGLTELGDGVSWARVDMRLINRMDPSSPAKFTGTIPPQGTSADKRFTTDYGYAGNVIGTASRGVYMQSPYYHQRYYDYSSDGNDEIGPTPYLLAAESDLVYAEALIRSGGSLTNAASLINNTRVTRGNLPAATAADGAATLLADIDYERDVELIATNGFTLFQRRHVDGLQKGTVLQLPIPAEELETDGLPIYTFGGVGGTSAAAYVGSSTPTLRSIVTGNAEQLLSGSRTVMLATPSGKMIPMTIPSVERTRHPKGL